MFLFIYLAAVAGRVEEVTAVAVATKQAYNESSRFIALQLTRSSAGRYVTNAGESSCEVAELAV